MSIKYIRKDLQEIQNNPIAGVTVSEGGNDVFEWIVTISGPEDTPYAGGDFYLKFSFPIDYRFRPPVVTFISKIYHPNVDVNGRFLIKNLEGWSPDTTARSLICAIISVLKTPELENALSPKIAEVYRESREVYQQNAREWTAKYASN
ncbi:ubiquitin-conjugating enzyme E2 [Pseudomonas parafulva]|uniref:ubiquitin-conjugating enzyme E2 n=1 Tax=Pseudomonas parafulva TaxID=157782 RepID=UPI003563E1BA